MKREVGKPMKKTLVIIASLRLGGAEKIGAELVTNMELKDNQVYFLVFGEEEGAYEKMVKEKGCKIIRIPWPKFPYFQYYKDLKRINKEVGGFDVVHSHTLLNNGINMAIFKSLGTKVRISHAHSTNSYRKDSFATRMYEKLMKNIIKKYATDYVACGEAAGNYLYGEKLFAEKGVVINNGIDFDKFAFNQQAREEIRKELGLEDEYVIGNISRLDKVKNHGFLLDVFSQVASLEPHSKLLIVGEGDELVNIKEKIRMLKLQDKVILTGARTDVDRIINAMDVAVYPSLFEGLPVSPIEAQINGVPCVLSKNITTEVKISEDVKFLSLYESVSLWGNEILSFKNKDRAKTTYTKAASKYDIKESAAQLEKIYTRF